METDYLPKDCMVKKLRQPRLARPVGTAPVLARKGRRLERPIAPLYRPVHLWNPRTPPVPNLPRPLLSPSGNGFAEGWMRRTKILADHPLT